MKAKISQVKAELSKFIRLAIKGEEVVITDRDQPVAKLVAFSTEAQLDIRPPEGDLKKLLAISDKRSFDQTKDILDVLSEDREDRF
jgi:antitoxin (DNA-binding transcriptional repressor) of toxin-antitoxin stability system